LRAWRIVRVRGRFPLSTLLRWTRLTPVCLAQADWPPALSTSSRRRRRTSFSSSNLVTLLAPRIRRDMPQKTGSARAGVESAGIVPMNDWDYVTPRRAVSRRRSKQGKGSRQERRSTTSSLRTRGSTDRRPRLPARAKKQNRRPLLTAIPTRRLTAIPTRGSADRRPGLRARATKRKRRWFQLPRTIRPQYAIDRISPRQSRNPVLAVIPYRGAF
jgi:hypothetical protein